MRLIDVFTYIGAGAAALAGLGYILSKFRSAARTADAIAEIVKTVPDRLDKIEQQQADAERRHEEAHDLVLEKVEKVDARLANIENHNAALNRELDVPVRQPPRAA